MLEILKKVVMVGFVSLFKNNVYLVQLHLKSVLFFLISNHL